MKLDRWIIVGLLVLLLGAGTYYGVFIAGLFGDPDFAGEVEFILPTAMGLSRGQIVMSSSQPIGAELGVIASLTPVTSGVLVTVRLTSGTSLPSGAHAVLRPGSPPLPSTLEIISGSDNSSSGGVIAAKSAALAPVAAGGFPLRIPADVEPGPPEGLVEPTPEWPLAQNP